jgi:hypothetical protein
MNTNNNHQPPFANRKQEAGSQARLFLCRFADSSGVRDSFKSPKADVVTGSPLDFKATRLFCSHLELPGVESAPPDTELPYKGDSPNERLFLYFRSSSSCDCKRPGFAVSADVNA